MLKLKISSFFLLVLLNDLHSNELSLWRNAFIQAGKTEALAPNLLVRNLAILSAASFDVLNAPKKSFHSYLPYSQKNTPNPLDEPTALRGCSLSLAKVLHPSQYSIFARIAHKSLLRKNILPDNSSFEFGKKIAVQYLKKRANDGATTKISYIPRVDPGKWRRTPPYFRPPEQPHWSKVTLFCLPNVKNFLPEPPPEPTSKEYFNAVKEVKLLGGKDSQLRSLEQTNIAKFWKDFSYSSTPPGHWNEIALSVSRKLNLTPLKEARLFALLNLAMADSGIIAWEAKYHFQLWRPIHAIQYANLFPTTKALADTNWKPLLETPPHPEYISGHACYSGAAAEILRSVTQMDVFEFIVKNTQEPHKKRTFSSFHACAQEVSNSRLFGGIHYRSTNVNSLQTGKKVAFYILKRFLLHYP